MNHDPATLPVPVIPCRTLDPELWFSDFREDVEQAQAGCARCPLQVKCLAGATERREAAGVWGGVRFRDGQPVHRRPAKVRHRKPKHPPAKHPRRKDRNRPGRRKGDLDPVLVDRAVAAIGARLPVDPGLTFAERRAVVERVYPRFGLSYPQVGELLGVSAQTVFRMASAARPDRAAAA